MGDKELKRSYFYKGLTAFCVVAACLLFYFLIYRINVIWNYVARVLRVLQPVIFGLVISYIVNPIVNFGNNKLTPLFLKCTKSEKKAGKAANIISVCLSLIIFCVFTVGLLASVIPQFVNSISNVITVLPGKIDSLVNWAEEFLKSNERVEELLVKALEYEKNWLQNDLANYVNRWAGELASGVFGMVNFLKNFGLGLVFAIYILFSKKLLLNQCKKLLCAIFKKKSVGRIFAWLKTAHGVFSGFINGKLLDSLIIGILCFIGVTVLRIPYPVLLAVIIGLTNVIPVFGPWIGGVPATLLVIMTDPIKGIYFGILVILLQALDGNVIGPKILGKKTGLSTLWVVFAIVLGGGMFGVPGMLIGVPTFAVAYYLFTAFINHLLRKKNMPIDSKSYENGLPAEDEEALNA